MCALCGECCLPEAGNILHTVHTSCHPTLQHHNSCNTTDNYRQWNAVGSPDDGHKDARNMLRYYWLPINHYLLHWFLLYFVRISCFRVCHAPHSFQLASFTRSVKWKVQIAILPSSYIILSKVLFSGADFYTTNPSSITVYKMRMCLAIEENNKIYSSFVLHLAPRSRPTP